MHDANCLGLGNHTTTEKHYTYIWVGNTFIYHMYHVCIYIYLNWIEYKQYII